MDFVSFQILSRLFPSVWWCPARPVGWCSAFRSMPAYIYILLALQPAAKWARHQVGNIYLMTIAVLGLVICQPLLGWNGLTRRCILSRQGMIPLLPFLHPVCLFCLLSSSITVVEISTGTGNPTFLGLDWQENPSLASTTVERCSRHARNWQFGNPFIYQVTGHLLARATEM